MVNKKSRYIKVADKKDKQSEFELYEMPLEKMDFETVKKVLSDHIADEEVEETEIETSEDDRFLELTVESLDEGVRKAGELLDVPIKELKYKIKERIRKSVEEEIKEFYRIEFRLKLVSGKSVLSISDDNFNAYFSILFPKTLDGKEVDTEYILGLIKEKGIKYGIQYEEIEEVVEKLKKNYDALRNVVVVKGKPSIKGKDCELLESIFSNINDIDYKKINDRSLFEILQTISLNNIRKNYFPVVYVEKDELIASTTTPGKGVNGIDIFGEKIEAEKGDLLYQVGKNVGIKIENDRVNYYSKIFGFLEYIDGKLNVHSPIWISENFLQAYYVGLPSLYGNRKKFSSQEIYDQLYDKGIKFGVNTDKIEEIIEKKNNENNYFFIELIAEGKEGRKGENAKVELFFEKDRKAGKILEDGRMDYKEIDLVKTVKSNQLIAVKYLPKEGVPGKNLRGDEIPYPKGDDIKFKPMRNVRIIEKDGKILYYSTIEGSVEIVGGSGITVNKMYEIKGNVDYSTGNVEFNGDVHIKGSVMSGFKIKAEGNIIVNGMVNQGAELISNGNISVKQGVVGRNYDTKLTSTGVVIAQYIQNSTIQAGSDIVVKDYIMNCIVKSRGEVITPDRDSSLKGKGSIFGGETIALKGIIANSIGSDLAKSTKVIIGVDFEFDKKIKNINKGLNYCEQEISKISKFLRLGFENFDTLKQRIAKLPKEKRKKFLVAFVKLNELHKLKDDLKKKKNEMIKEVDKLSKNARIVVNKKLYPRVNIQIGDAKTKTEKELSRVKLKASKDAKNVVFVNLK